MKILPFLPTVALLAAATTACHKPSSHPGAAAPALPTASVRVEAVASAPHAIHEEVVGTVRPRTRILVEAKISGRIEVLPVALGQTVSKGDVLFQLDAREIQARLDQAIAVRRQAERDLERFTSLLKQEAVTQAEFDAMEARHRVAQAGVTEAETLLGYARVVAPANLVVTRKLAEVGDLASPGRLLIELEDPEALRLEAEIPEALISRVRPGVKFPVQVSSLARSLEGTVAEVSPSADAASRTFRVKLELPSTPGLRSGQFARLSIPLDEAPTLRVPAAAVVTRGQIELVFIATNQTARLRLVKTGRRIGDDIELVSGVSAGEQVVVEPVAALSDGQPIQVR